MAWAKGETNTLTATSLDVDLGATTALTAKKFSQVLYHLLDDGTGSSGDSATYYNFNNDAGTKYANRVSEDGSADSTFTSQTAMYGQLNVATDDFFNVVEICAISGEEILWINHVVEKVAAGAGTAPSRAESVNKCTITTQFTRLDANNNRGTSIGYEYDVDSNATILGTD